MTYTIKVRTRNGSEISEPAIEPLITEISPLHFFVTLAVLFLTFPLSPFEYLALLLQPYLLLTKVLNVLLLGDEEAGMRQVREVHAQVPDQRVHQDQVARVGVMRVEFEGYW